MGVELSSETNRFDDELGFGVYEDSIEVCSFDDEISVLLKEDSVLLTASCELSLCPDDNELLMVFSEDDDERVAEDDTNGDELLSIVPSSRMGLEEMMISSNQIKQSTLGAQ